jgi:hypothetical protein
MGNTYDPVDSGVEIRHPGTEAEQADVIDHAPVGDEFHGQSLAGNQSNGSGSAAERMHYIRFEAQQNFTDSANGVAIESAFESNALDWNSGRLQLRKMRPAIGPGHNIYINAFISESDDRIRLMSDDIVRDIQDFHEYVSRSGSILKRHYILNSIQ